MPPPIHVVNPFWNASGGSEWRAWQLFDDLAAAADARAWTETTPAAPFAADGRLTRIDVDAGRLPRGGTLIIVGSYFPLGDWLERAQPARVVLIHNTLGPLLLERTLARLASCSLEAEIVYTSELARLAGGRPGLVQYPPVDLARFQPRREPRPGGFVAGRLSRDIDYKHHPEDGTLYAALLAAAIDVELMGAESVAAALPEHPRLVRRAAGSLDAVDFLHRLDCLVYRTSPAWCEPFGRIVAEAAACGVPCVAHRSGGYCEVFADGVDILLFGTTAEAVTAVRRLRDDAALRTRVARAARDAVAAFSDEQARAHWRQWFLS
ncbi:MAG: glycosyltransferase [Gammaproteobacteria bacterium]